MKVGEKEYSEIFITDNENNLLVSISDEVIIEEKNCKAVCVLANNNLEEKTESCEEMLERLNRNIRNFIVTEALKIFHKTKKEETALRALELIGRDFIL